MWNIGCVSITFHDPKAPKQKSCLCIILTAYTTLKNGKRHKIIRGSRSQTEGIYFATCGPFKKDLVSSISSHYCILPKPLQLWLRRTRRREDSLRSKLSRWRFAEHAHGLPAPHEVNKCLFFTTHSSNFVAFLPEYFSTFPRSSSVTG